MKVYSIGMHKDLLQQMFHSPGGDVLRGNEPASWVGGGRSNHSNDSGRVTRFV